MGRIAHSQANQRQLLTWLAEGKITPLVSQTYPLARAADALNAILARQATGKVVLTMQA